MVKRKKTCKMFAGLLAVVVLIFGLSGCRGKTDLGSSEAFSIDTPYVTIDCPASDVGAVCTAIQDEAKYTVAFYGKIGEDTEYRLFDIWFSDSEEQSIGQVKTKDNGSIYLGVTLYPVEENEKQTHEEIDAVYAMQELVNSILENMKWVESEQETFVTEYEETDDLVIDTPYIPLTYPGKWEDVLYIEKYVDGDIYQVEFYGMLPEKELQHLFTIQFGVEGDAQLGSVYSENGDKIPVNLILGVFNPDNGWTEEEKQAIYAMQEGLNDLINNLALESN